MSTLKVNTVLSADTPTVNITDGLNVTGVSTVAALNTTSIVNDTPLSNRNIIINGAMTVSQRGTSFTDNGDVSANAYTLDRFKSERDTDGAATITQSGTSPDGFTSSLKYDITTADTSLAASQYAQITYKVEAQDLQHLAYGTSAAKTITLSFYVRSNKTGNYNFVYEQPDNGNRLASYQYTINSANTWERKVITTAGDTSGVINDDTGAGFNMKWGLAYGATYTSGSNTNQWAAQNNANFGAGQDVNLLDSASNEWYITGIQLEVGSQATDFEHRSYGDELQRCMRYYERQSVSDCNGGYATVAMGHRNTSTRVIIQPNFRVIKRATNATFEFNGPMRVIYQNDGASQTIDSRTTVQNRQFGLHGGYIVLDRSGGVGGSDGETFRLEEMETLVHT